MAPLHVSEYHTCTNHVRCYQIACQLTSDNARGPHRESEFRGWWFKLNEWRSEWWIKAPRTQRRSPRRNADPGHDVAPTRKLCALRKLREAPAQTVPRTRWAAATSSIAPTVAIARKPI